MSDEAAAASRLAWAATNPSVQSGPIQSALRDYLQTTRAREWRGVAAASGDDPAARRAVARLEREVRTEAVRTEVKTPTSAELLARRGPLDQPPSPRIAATSREIPALYVLTLVASGLALIATPVR